MNGFHLAHPSNTVEGSMGKRPVDIDDFITEFEPVGEGIDRCLGYQGRASHHRSGRGVVDRGRAPQSGGCELALPIPCGNNRVTRPVVPEVDWSVPVQDLPLNARHAAPAVKCTGHQGLPQFLGHHGQRGNEGIVPRGVDDDVRVRDDSRIRAGVTGASGTSATSVQGACFLMT